MYRLISFMGCLTIVVVAYILSSSRKNINWKLVFWGFAFQFFIGIIIIPNSFFNIWLKDITGLKMSPGGWLFSNINDMIIVLLGFTDEGMTFLLARSPIDEPLFNNFIFRALPILIFLSSLTAILYHLGIMQYIINFFAVIMSKAMKTSGAESLAVASNIFVGMVESALAIRPFLERLTRSELFAIMVSGMATVAGTVFAMYVALLKDAIPNIAGHLITASVMSAPAAFILAKMLIPETDRPETYGHIKVNIPIKTVNILDAAATGAKDGVKLALNIGAILLAFVALIFFVNHFVTAPQKWFGITNPITIQGIAGYIFAPVAFLLGIPWDEAVKAGILLAEKTIINEWVAYDHLAKLINNEAKVFSERSGIILSYALCGFANFASVGVMIGGISSMVPKRSHELAKLGLKSLLGGLLAGFMTACMAGIII